jgi:alpha-L-rhamnosidase
MDRNQLAVALLVIVCALSASMACAVGSGHLRPRDLRCEYLRDPLGVEERSPRLGWIVESDRRAESVSGYRILVASSLERLSHDEGDLWDSGEVQSNSTIHVPYAGTALVSRQTCFWKVMVWDHDGLAGSWSESARWEMGLLSPEDWTAKWIDAAAKPVDVEVESATYYSVDGAVRKDVTQEVTAMLKQGKAVIASNTALGGDPAPNVIKRLAIEYRMHGASLHSDVAENASAVLAHSQWPYLRKAFEMRKPIARARLYSTALGMYELYLNSQRVGDQYLAPGWTDYRRD